ncbi:MAG: glutaredoxin family protein [Gemmataceae bacterium]|nr:glutaredoxin family protein [Gemmataceae bacterium]
MMGWSWGRRRKRPDLAFELLTRSGCHLCETAHRILDDAQRRYGFALTVRDVDADPNLVERFGACVPVVLVNGVVRFRGRINEVLLRRLLDAP